MLAAYMWAEERTIDIIAAGVSIGMGGKKTRRSSQPTGGSIDRKHLLEIAAAKELGEPVVASREVIKTLFGDEAIDHTAAEFPAPPVTPPEADLQADKAYLRALHDRLMKMGSERGDTARLN